VAQIMSCVYICWLHDCTKGGASEESENYIYVGKRYTNFLYMRYKLIVEQEKVQKRHECVFPRDLSCLFRKRTLILHFNETK
jgi:hypothetical protein